MFRDFLRFLGLWIHAAQTFTLTEIRANNFKLAKDLYKSLHKRIEERRIVYLQNFIKNPNKESDFDTALIKSELKALNLRFAKVPEKILYHSTSIIW